MKEEGNLCCISVPVRTASEGKDTQCQGPINSGDTTPSLHPPHVCANTHTKRNAVCRANRYSTNTCTQTLVCVQQDRLKTLPLAAR